MFGVQLMVFNYFINVSLSQYINQARQKWGWDRGGFWVVYGWCLWVNVMRLGVLFGGGW